jgi:hypothetical protein
MRGQLGWANGGKARIDSDPGAWRPLAGGGTECPSMATGKRELEATGSLRVDSGHGRLVTGRTVTCTPVGSRGRPAAT